MKDINEEVLRVLITEEQIDARCKELASQIEADYENKNPLLLCLINGSLPFLGNLIKYIRIPMEYDCIRVHSYQGQSSTGNVIVENYNFDKLKGRHIILIEDIIDTGLTLHTLKQMLKSIPIGSVEICSLLNKPGLNQIDVGAKYIGFEIPSEFVIGFGLDYNEQYRNLPYIGIMNPKAIK